MIVELLLKKNEIFFILQLPKEIINCYYLFKWILLIIKKYLKKTEISMDKLIIKLYCKEKSFILWNRENDRKKCIP